MPDRRAEWLEQIRGNIARFGHHVTLVQGGLVPRFAYTIGLSEREGGQELVLAGANALSAEEVTAALNAAAAGQADGFELRPVHPSWSERLLLGVHDLYSGREVAAQQMVPPAELVTVDVPDLSQPYGHDPVWRWVEEPWPFAVPKDAVAVTNLDALRGRPVTEAARWEEDQWELFHGSGPDTPPDDIRVVPLATLLGGDATLEAVVGLDVGTALRREPGGDWERWGS
jgi:hypothetical protein